jgi:hypothetical protein
LDTGIQLQIGSDFVQHLEVVQRDARSHFPYAAGRLTAGPFGGRPGCGGGCVYGGADDAHESERDAGWRLVWSQWSPHRDFDFVHWLGSHRKRERAFFFF